MTAKEMIEWYAEHKGYTLTLKCKDTVQRQILAYLYMDLAQGILTRNSVQELKSIKGLTEFTYMNNIPDIYSIPKKLLE